MTSKLQTNKNDQTNMDLGQKEAAMEKLGKDKMDHMGTADKSKPTGEKAKAGTDNRLKH